MAKGSQIRFILTFMLIPFLFGAKNIQLSDIQTAIIQKDYSNAENLARKFIGQSPQKAASDEAQYYLGLSLLRLGKSSQARDVFTQLIEYRPNKKLRNKAHLGIVDSYYLQENYSWAIHTGEELLEEKPDLESLVYLKLARSNLKLAKWSEAQKLLQKIISHYPNSPEGHTAKQLLDEKQYFAVQIGAFINQDRAQQLVGEVQQKGEYAYIVETVDKSGRKFFRVRVGQISRLKEAKRLMSKLSNLGYPAEIYP